MFVHCSVMDNNQAGGQRSGRPSVFRRIIRWVRRRAGGRQAGGVGDGGGQHQVCVCVLIWLCRACVFVNVSLYIYVVSIHKHTHTHTHIHCWKEILVNSDVQMVFQWKVLYLSLIHI
eukprot:TRINITY_DN40839_c0_g1_i6.p1 TRINITY_DN40839_c0_g1~~TRINITY_DN40839_c0_g1_i6.p1  ORF type:complete len:117 (-),score=19.00 TRINITY_DN40839_c0_g1_i6:4-354(-)